MKAKHLKGSIIGILVVWMILSLLGLMVEVNRSLTTNLEFLLSILNFVSNEFVLILDVCEILGDILLLFL